MFTPKPKNRKRRKSLTRSRHSRSSQRNEVESLRQEEFRLNAEIGSLEDILSELETREAKERELSRQAVLTPFLAHHQPQSPRRQSYAQRRQRDEKKHASRVRFFILLAIAAALAIWLFYTGG